MTTPGSLIGVGTTPDKNFVIVSNNAVRGGIPTRYVGVWCYITSHKESWKLTELRVAKELKVGRDFVRSALKSFEAAGCLIRTQERSSDEPDGRFGESVWFVTSLPFILRDAGIDDEDLIRERVEAEHKQWLASHGYTSDEKPQKPRNPSSGPMLGYPSSGEPSSGNPTPKKTMYKKTNETEDQSSVGGASDNEPGLFDSSTQASSDADASKPTTPKTTPTSKRPKRGTRLSEDFQVTPEMVAWFRQECPDVDGRRETERFKNYWLSRTDKGAVKGDWVRTWKNWMLKEQSQIEERRNAREARAAQFHKPTQDEKVLGLLDIARAASQNGGLLDFDNDPQLQLTGGGDSQ